MIREKRAGMTALATGGLIVGAVVLFAFLNRPSVPQADARPDDAPTQVAREAPEAAPDTLVERGREVYAEQRCSACHSIAGEGSPRYPLDGVGSRLTPEELRLWVVDPQEIQPGVRKPAYDDLPEQEVAALVAYMESLREPR